MQRAHRFFLRWQLALTTFAWFVAVNLARVSLAQEEEVVESGPAGESWTLAYALVFVGIVFGLVLVCRPILRNRDLSGGE